MIVRVTQEAYWAARERAGHDAPTPEETFEEGTRSYLEHPRVIKLMMGGVPEERLDELMLMLAQSRASYAVIEIWNATEGGDYTATREEYTALADEFERLQGQKSRLEAEIKALSREVTELEVKLRDLGDDPDEVEPPFPATVTRPASNVPASVPRQGPLRKIWRCVSSLGGS